MHTEPSRTSPSFGQIPENGKVDVIGHKLTPRVQHDDVSMPVPVKPAPIRKKPKPKRHASQDRAAAASARAEAAEKLAGAFRRPETPEPDDPPRPRRRPRRARS